MIIYCLFYWTGNRGNELRGIFSTLEKAELAREHLCADPYFEDHLAHNFNIEEREIDQMPPLTKEED